MAEVKQCALCCSPYNGAQVIFSMECGHIFHFNCMEDFQRRCPRCQTYDPDTFKMFSSYSHEIEFRKVVEKLRAEKDALRLELDVKNKNILMLIGRSNEDKENFKNLQKTYEKACISKSQYLANLESAYNELKNANISMANHSAKDIFNLIMGKKECESRLNLKEDEVRSLNAEKAFILAQYQALLGHVTSLETSLRAMQSQLPNFDAERKQDIMKNNLADLKHETKVEAASTSQKVVLKKTQNESNADAASAMKQADFNHKDILNSENVIIIKNFCNELPFFRYKSAIIEMAKLMKLKIHDEDILLAKFLKPSNSRSYNAAKTMCVEFRDLDLKNAFLDCRGVLKKYKETADLVLFGYRSIETQLLLRFANSLRNYNYTVFCRNDKVMVAKPNQSPFRVHTEKQVQQLMRSAETSRAKKGKSTVRKNRNA